ncbi:TPA: TonB-dependent receptor plug domain-containing protein, partial [Escherichia coli]|nr:TonB-dependent receptor plug domain-containing protein [Escherichia coli]
IENQQAQSVSEMLKYSPSTQMQARGGMDVGRPQSRGMQGSVVANSRLDGLNIVSTTAFPVEMLERMDVLNSLTGALYGPASPAGQFNFVAKRPTEETLRKVTLGYLRIFSEPGRQRTLIAAGKQDEGTVSIKIDD